MSNDSLEEVKPAIVSETKQVGEVRARWAWTEPCIWTERMLTALEEGVKGGKWFSLIDKFFTEQGLFSFVTAHAQVRQSLTG